MSTAINTRLAEIQTVEEFNTRCQAYDNIHEEIRGLDDLIRAERVNGKTGCAAARTSQKRAPARSSIAGARSDAVAYQSSAAA